MAGASAALLATVPTTAAPTPSRQPSLSNGRAEDWATSFAGGPAAGAPALSIAVADQSGATWEWVHGSANLEFRIPTAPNHLFRLGSVSKVVTAMAAVRMVSQGTIDLSAPISAYLSDLPEQHRETTLLQLLTHRGGVRHFAPGDFNIDAPGGAVYQRSYPSEADILAVFINDPLITAPGERVAYSTFGYTLASLVMQQAAGRPFVQLIAELLGTQMNLAGFTFDDPVAIIPDRVGGYVAEADRPILYGLVPPARRPVLPAGITNMPFSNPAYSWAGAGLLGTAAAMAQFGSAMIEGPSSKITAAERGLLFSPQTAADRGNPPLGLGWRIDADSRGRLRWHHAGSTPGGRASLVVFPQQGLSIAIASNIMTAPGDVLGPSSQLADIFA